MSTQISPDVVRDRRRRANKELADLAERCPPGQRARVLKVLADGYANNTYIQYVADRGQDVTLHLENMERALVRARRIYRRACAARARILGPGQS
jgi:hypothetical protein